MQIHVAVYGTLRMEVENWSSTMSHFDPNARSLAPELGAWTLDDYGLYTEHLSIPAIKAREGSSVVCDVFDVSVEGFKGLLWYESWPQSYDFTSVVVEHRTDHRKVEAIVFTHPDADYFGPLSTTGDWYNPVPVAHNLQEV